MVEWYGDVRSACNVPASLFRGMLLNGQFDRPVEGQLNSSLLLVDPGIGSRLLLLLAAQFQQPSLAFFWRQGPFLKRGWPLRQIGEQNNQTEDGEAAKDGSNDDPGLGLTRRVAHGA